MQHKTGIDYFMQGWRLLFHPAIRRFVILPMLANVVVMSLLFGWLFIHLHDLLSWAMSYVPTWLQWLSYVIYGVVVIIMALFFGYFFSTITNMIAAPFNGFLAEKVEILLSGESGTDMSIWSLLKDIPRILMREVYKFLYYLKWIIPIFLLHWLPVIGQTAAPIIWFIFTAWMMNIQYADYAFDNHKVSFKQMRQILRRDPADNLLFGSLCSFFTMVPILNLVIMPVAVCGSTAMWVDRYRHYLREPNSHQPNIPIRK